MSTNSPSPIALDAQVLLQTLQLQLASMMTPNTVLVGIARGGAHIANRMHQALGLQTPLGVVSSSLHRDDFDKRGMVAGVQTQLPFGVDGADIILVDDVLYTGRTIRAVLNELYDFGRPARVRLVALISRTGRELPICADFAALHVDEPAHVSLVLNTPVDMAWSISRHHLEDAQSSSNGASLEGVSR